MALPFFYIEKYAQQHIITLAEETSKHIVQVLRMQAGEQLLLTDGLGNMVTAAIIDAHKKKCIVQAVEVVQKAVPKQQISIAISILKNSSRFEWFLEKATEIGVTEIIPLLCSRTEKNHFRHDRMQHILISAMLQSQQAWLPVLQQPQTFMQTVQTSAKGTRLIAHCVEAEKQQINLLAIDGAVEILIGPEGDFTPVEIDAAITHNYIPVALGNTRLRTETAGMVAAALLANKG